MVLWFPFIMWKLTWKQCLETIVRSDLSKPWNHCQWWFSWQFRGDLQEFSREIRVFIYVRQLMGPLQPNTGVTYIQVITSQHLWAQNDWVAWSISDGTAMRLQLKKYENPRMFPVPTITCSMRVQVSFWLVAGERLFWNPHHEGKNII